MIFRLSHPGREFSNDSTRRVPTQSSSDDTRPRVSMTPRNCTFDGVSAAPPSDEPLPMTHRGKGPLGIAPSVLRRTLNERRGQPRRLLPRTAVVSRCETTADAWSQAAAALSTSICNEMHFRSDGDRHEEDDLLPFCGTRHAGVHRGGHGSR